MRRLVEPLAGLLRAAVGAFALVLAAPPASGADLDWCAPIAVRPDQRVVDTTTCTSIYSDATIAADGEAVMLGDFTDVAHPVVPAPGRSCFPSPSHTANAVWVQRLKNARAATGKPPLEIVHMSRVELVPFAFAALPGFAASFLATTARPWADVLGFFSNDRSAPCSSGQCRWNDSWSGSEALNPVGKRIRDYIDAVGGSGRYQSIVYYMAAPTDPIVHWPTAAIADLRNASYRAWRVAEAAEAIRVGGYTAIDLSHKVFQYKQNGHWIGSAYAPDVAGLNATGDTYWTAPPQGYGYSEYVQGWTALARDMKAAGVPYTIAITYRAWVANGLDDLTTSVNEADLLREAMRGARVLFLDRPRDLAASTWDPIVAELAALGVRVIGYDLACGYGPATAVPSAPGQPHVF